MPPCAGLRDERAALPSPRAAPGKASPPCPARDVRPPPRVSALRGGMIALWKPHSLLKFSLPAASGQRGGSQSACSVLLVACPCLPISRVVAVDRSSFPNCAASLASWRPALGHTSATLPLHTAHAQQPALRVRPAAATHLRIPVALSASLCAPAAEVFLPIRSPSGSFPALSALLPIV